MRRLLICTFLLISSFPALGAPPTYEEKLEDAHDAVADKEWNEAIPLFEQLIREAGSPAKAEPLVVELAMAYFASGALGKTVDTCNRFLTTYKGSNRTWQVQHLKAFALWSQGLFDESYSVFSGKNWEELRALPQPLRGRVYDVIARALKGTHDDSGVRVVRAEGAGKIKTESGQWILTGNIDSTLRKLDSEAVWDALLKKVPPATRVLLTEGGLEEKPKAPEAKLRWGYFGISFAGNYGTVETSTTDYSQMFIDSQFEVDFLLSETGSQVGVYAGYSLLPLSTSAAGEQLRWLHAGILFDGRVFGGGRKGLSFSVNFGLFYRVSQVEPASQPRLTNCFGLDLYPSFRYQFANGSSLGWYGKVSPYAQNMRNIDLGNNLISGGGMDYHFTAIPEKLWVKVFAEGERTRFRFDDGSLFENIQVRVGARAFF